MIENVPAGVVDVINCTLAFCTLMAIVSHMITTYKNHKEIMRHLKGE